MKWLLILIPSLTAVTPWLIEYNKEKKTKEDAIKWCNSIQGVLTSLEDGVCFQDGRAVWIQEESNMMTEEQGKVCAYWDGTGTGSTSCNTLLSFYCKTYASSKLTTFGTQQNLTNANVNINLKDNLFMNLQTCSMTEITLHGSTNEPQYTIRIGQQNAGGSRNIIIYSTNGPNTVIENTSNLHQNEPCQTFQMYTVSWRHETANKRMLSFLTGWNFEDKNVVSGAVLNQTMPQEVTISSIGGNAVWYFYAPQFQDSTMSSEEVKLIPGIQDNGFIAFELKTCDIGKLSAMSTKYEYDILFDGLKEGSGRKAYIINRKTSNATQVVLDTDSDTCLNYRFYFVKITEEGQTLAVNISTDMTEFIRAELKRKDTKSNAELLVFYNIIQDNRNWEKEKASDAPLGEWNIFDQKQTCAENEAAKWTTVTADYKTLKPITNSVNYTYTEPSGISGTVDSTTETVTEKAKIITEEEDNSRQAQIIGISVGVSVVVLVGLILLIASMVVKYRSNREQFGGSHHGRSMSDFMFPGEVNLSPVNLTHVSHDGEVDNVYSTCDQRQPASTSAEASHNYLTVNSGQRGPV